MERQSFPLDAAVVTFLAGSFVVTAWRVDWPFKAAGVTLVLAYLLVSYFLADDLGARGRRASWIYGAKLGLVLALVACLAVGPTVDEMRTRQREGLNTNAHDGVLQAESAIEFVLDGENPYTRGYEDTPLGRWDDWPLPYPNPAIYYLAYLPGIFLAGMPLRAISQAAFGWYDQRLLYVLALAAALWAWGTLTRDRLTRLLALAVIALNPMAAPYFVEGRNDIMIVALVGLSLVALRSGAGSAWGLPLSGALFGLACGTKQSAWFLAPFLLLYVWRSHGPARASAQSRGTDGREAAVRWLAPVLLVAGALILPFFLWDPRSFWEDTISFVSGNVEHNYPLKRGDAYGVNVFLYSDQFSRVLDTLSSGPLSPLRPLTNRFKVVGELEPYPSWVFQAIFALPMLALALRRQRRVNTLASALTGYALFLFVYWYFSRNLHDSYIGFVTTFWALAYLIREPGQRRDRDGTAMVNLSQRREIGEKVSA